MRWLHRGVGIKPVEITRRLSFMEPFQPAVKLLFTHQDQVELLPRNAERLGTSPHCLNEMMLLRHPVSRRPKAFSCQGHIELSRDYLKQVYTTRKGERTAVAGLRVPCTDAVSAC